MASVTAMRMAASKTCTRKSINLITPHMMYNRENANPEVHEQLLQTTDSCDHLLHNVLKATSRAVDMVEIVDRGLVYKEVLNTLSVASLVPDFLYGDLGMRLVCNYVDTKKSSLPSKLRGSHPLYSFLSN